MLEERLMSRLRPGGGGPTRGRRGDAEKRPPFLTVPPAIRQERGTASKGFQVSISPAYRGEGKKELEASRCLPGVLEMRKSLASSEMQPRTEAVLNYSPIRQKSRYGTKYLLPARQSGEHRARVFSQTQAERGLGANLAAVTYWLF